MAERLAMKYTGLRHSAVLFDKTIPKVEALVNMVLTAITACAYIFLTIFTSNYEQDML